MGFAINKWQRLVLVIGATVFIVAAVAISLNSESDRSPAFPFLISIILSVAALGPARDDGEFIPYGDWLRVNWRQAIAGAALIIASVIGILVATNHFRPRYPTVEATSEAPVDNIELPAEESMNSEAPPDDDPFSYSKQFDAFGQRIEPTSAPNE